MNTIVGINTAVGINILHSKRAPFIAMARRNTFKSKDVQIIERR